MFKIDKKIPNTLGRAGVITTPHGEIKTPAFATVATKGAVRALSPEETKNTGSQVILSNTYHLHLRPGEKIVQKAGGLHKFANWDGPMITDSGGFQVFSLGAAYGKQISKISKTPETDEEIAESVNPKTRKKLVSIDEDGVNFKDPIDGSQHRFTPEKSIEIQHQLGADIIFAFDECPSPLADHKYQEEAMDRTHRWAERSLTYHQNQGEGKVKRFIKTLFGEAKSAEEDPNDLPEQFLFGIVQGGRFEDLRKRSALKLAKMDFDGYGIGGSFQKEDIHKALKWVTLILPEEKPRHLLGIGEPRDILEAIENGADMFDCVLPTRLARNGALLTHQGRINILNHKYTTDLKPIEEGCECHACKHYSRSYICHLLKSKEMLGSSLASIHNLYFMNKLFREAREKILEGNFLDFKADFMSKYH